MESFLINFRNPLVKYFQDSIKINNNFLTVEEQKDLILQSMRSIERKSCVRFREAAPSDNYTVLIKNDRPGCSSDVGLLRIKEQMINLGSKKCMTNLKITHELLHCLGFLHQQNSYDRDKYVKILYKNIRPETFDNFAKLWDLLNVGFTYDYKSIMHYSNHAFTKNGEPTIISLTDVPVNTNHNYLTDKDILKLNILYKCSKEIHSMFANKKLLLHGSKK